jgi:hypothetical protein
VTYQLRWHIEINDHFAKRSEGGCNLMGLAFDMGASFPHNNRDGDIDLSPQLGIETELGDRIIDSLSQIETRPIAISPSAENLDVKAELESLLQSLKLTNPHPPNPGSISKSSQIIAIAGLDKFGGHQEIYSMLEQLESTRHSLVNANTQITTMHEQILEESQAMQARMIEIDRGFVDLVASVQTEKEQFYELTVESIEKAETIAAQLANIIKQISHSRDSISTLKTELKSIHDVQQEIAQKLQNLDLQDREIIARWNDVQNHQKNRAIATGKIKIWMWILSVGVGIILGLVIRILTVLK